MKAATRAHPLPTMLLGALLVACTTPEGPMLRAPDSSSPRATRPALAPDSPAAFFADVIGTVHAQYVDPIAVARLAAAALQGLENVLPKGAIRVVETAQGATLAHGESGSAETTVSLSWPPDPSVEDASLALQEGSRFVVRRLGVHPGEVVDAMLRGLMTVDAEGRYVEPAELAGQPGSEPAGGVGVEVALWKGDLIVVATIPGGPAEQAGLRAGDRIVSIDGQPAAPTLDGSIRLLRSKPGSRAVLVVARREGSAPREVVMTRATRDVPSVERAMLDRVGYLRIRRFVEETAAQLRGAVDALRAEGARALVLDLRGNSGGLLVPAIEVAELFLPTGRMLAFTEGRSGGQNMKFTSRAKEPILDLPLAILVDGRTAAGSEIVAGALQDWVRATIVGTRTAERATIQTTIRLRGGGALHLTTARWYTLKGATAERRRGLRLDVEVPSSDDDNRFLKDPQRDAQLRRALEVVGVAIGR